LSFTGAGSASRRSHLRARPLDDASSGLHLTGLPPTDEDVPSGSDLMLSGPHVVNVLAPRIAAAKPEPFPDPIPQSVPHHRGDVSLSEVSNFYSRCNEARKRYTRLFSTNISTDG
jgi:hypothetical protein